MTSIVSFIPKKFEQSIFTSCGQDIFEHDGIFFIAIRFQQEPQLGEGTSPQNISQYPLEDILDQYGVWISDFYEDLNKRSSETCYLEFAGHNMNAILSLREIVGKHVYNKKIDGSEGPTEELVIE